MTKDKKKKEKDEDKKEKEDEEFEDEFDDDFDDDDDADDEDEDEEYDPEPNSYDDFKQQEDDAPPTQVLKLEVGEEVRGRLVKIEKQTNSDSHGNMITSKVYHILSPGEEEPWKIYGTTVLDQWMNAKEEGDRLVIKRLDDKPSRVAGRNPTQMYKTFTIVKRKKKKHSEEKTKKKKKHHEEDDDEDED